MHVVISIKYLSPSRWKKPVNQTQKGQFHSGAIDSLGFYGKYYVGIIAFILISVVL